MQVCSGKRTSRLFLGRTLLIFVQHVTGIHRGQLPPYSVYSSREQSFPEMAVAVTGTGLTKEVALRSEGPRTNTVGTSTLYVRFSHRHSKSKPSK